MQGAIRPLPFAPSALRGLSARLVGSHHENNYGGAVKRLAAIRARLAAAEPLQLPAFELNGLKREELLAANSIRLHELYFASLGGDGAAIEPAWAMALAASFGSFQRWRDEFVALGRALGGGSGWVLLTFEPDEGTLVNQWAGDHAHTLAGGVPLLALDMYEHAYQLDYGAAAGRYVDAFMDNIDWQAVYARYRQAVHAASEEFGCAEPVDGTTLLDVRRAPVFAQADAVIAGADWRDPQQVGAWSRELPRGANVTVYCAYGHEVGRATALRLRAAGVDARFLRGGIDGWRAAGRPVEPKEALQ
jgi:Fe-Mn family superoxide dismutase